VSPWLEHLLQTNDSMFPTGAYAHSFGLEGLVEDGTVIDEESLRDYLLHAFLPAVASMDLPLVHAAWCATASGSADTMMDLDDLAGALRPTRELRLASRRTGSQRLATIIELKPHALLCEFQHRGGGHAAIVFGMECALWEVPDLAAVQAYGYQALAGQIAAAMKLISMGQLAAQRLLGDLMTELARHVDTATDIVPDDAGWFQPLADIASGRHERAHTRLFIS
jgi:urease accessory protein